MKTRFNTFDILCVVGELQQYVGMRVNNVYDIDNKTFLIKLQRTEEKAVILLESGIRIHSTAFEWPKNMAPSGFSMKMRKHIRNKRLESLTQLGVDRIIDLQFGSGEAAYHVILELYDRGNLILTDHELKILYILRPHTEGESVRFFVKEIYPQNRGRESKLITREDLTSILEGSKPGDQLKKALVSKLEYGPALIEHVLIGKGFNNNCKIGKTFNITTDFEQLFEALIEADDIFRKAKEVKSKGYIIQKKEDKVSTKGDTQAEYFLSNQEFHPVLFRQHENSPYKEFDCFNNAIDEFFSSMESQKIELKALHQEKEALKKLENVKKDHQQRLVALEKTQEIDKQKAELITRNQEIVEKAILAVQSALANQLPWDAINDLVKEAASQGDPIAQTIKELKLQTNHITLYLTDPYDSEEASNESDEEAENNKIKSMAVDVDLALSAFANATRYYNQKRHAAKKQEKTIKSQTVALKSAEKKTKQTLKEVETITNIQKARKVYWFEKFFWFISSENYLVIAGRDQQQNELLVKRYLKPTDLYVHADVHGASSVVIKNPTSQPVPPKTLNEAGTMAICYSVAWEAKVVTNAYWVWGDQVSKTAPTGEYLTTGSFMVRGKKNFLPPSHLILGLSFLFRLEDSFVEKHLGERKVLTEGAEYDMPDQNMEHKDDVEIDIPDEDDAEDDKEKDEESAEINVEKLETLKEEVNEADSSDSEENDIKYPDTHLRIEHKTDTAMNIIPQSTTPKEDDTLKLLANMKPFAAAKNRGNNKQKNKQATENNNHKNNEENNANKQQMKRGQRSKLKKIKEKYKDQDDEERQLRMEILQSSGANKENKKNKKSKDTNQNATKKVQPHFSRAPKVNNKEDDGGDEEEVLVQVDVDMINALTGIPSTEDELLFAVPVVAPYSTLTNYKFKVKITPGTGKKGKAAKTAVAIFMKDRAITQREKDLLKAVKDDQLARNFPGKVKLSAPKLQALKK
ncbi:nuclear export mediator factor NEMF homolog isoform X1 [Harmonia axyridis]|uniref:nuclear export mediator factor NEMF homolog isoform X1 n=1 Tax=Harmonia axyridis TaxID=115357 RepID=UPI001E276F88|nr:nuclear export mediator factor NEMF homolog isoform X1 [Harmonia axyridis]